MRSFTVTGRRWRFRTIDGEVLGTDETGFTGDVMQPRVASMPVVVESLDAPPVP